MFWGVKRNVFGIHFLGVKRFFGGQKSFWLLQIFLVGKTKFGGGAKKFFGGPKSFLEEVHFFGG